MITLVVLFGGTHSEAVCAANDHEQAMGRVSAAIEQIVECSPLLRTQAKITADKISIAGAVISAITSNYASAAGSNPVISTFDELWAYGTERACVGCSMNWYHPPHAGSPAVWWSLTPDSPAKAFSLKNSKTGAVCSNHKSLPICMPVTAF